MDDQLEGLLQEYMRKRTESVCLSADLLTSARNSYAHRRKVRHRILTGCGAIGVIILVAGLVFGVALAKGGGQSSGSKVATKTGASASTTNAATDKGAMAIVLLRKALSVATPTKGEILHVKYRSIETNSTVEGGDTVEYWWTGDETKYMSRTIYADAAIQTDSLEIYPGRFLNYTHIPGSGSSLWWDKTASGGFGEGTPGEFVKRIQDQITAGQAVEAGHDWIDRRDAVRIVVDQGVGKDMIIYYLDAQTYYPLECQSISDTGELDAVSHYDVYESLPATAENLKVFDEKAFLASHPGLPLQH